MKPISEKSLVIFNYLMEHDGEDLTAQDIADALGLEKKSVDCVVTAGLQRKKFTVREEAQIKDADGKYQTVKFIKLTDEGRAYDHEAAIEAEAAEKAAKAAAKAE